MQVCSISCRSNTEGQLPEPDHQYDTVDSGKLRGSGDQHIGKWIVISAHARNVLELTNGLKDD